MADTDTIPEQFAAYQFLVIIPRLSSHSGWQSVSGLTQEQEVKAYSRCNDLDGTIKVPGILAPGDVTLSKGMTPDRQLISWFEDIHKRYRGERVQTGPSDARIGFYDRQGGLKRTAKLVNAWPARLEFGGLDASQSGILLQSMTLTCDEIQFDS